MRCGHFKQEQQALAVVDPDGLYCGVKDAHGSQRAFDRAYNKWCKRRKIPRGKFNAMQYGQKAEE